MDFPLTIHLPLVELTITRLDAEHYVLEDGRTVPFLGTVPSFEDAATSLALWLDGAHPVQLAGLRADLKRRATARRYEVEVAGITVGGVPVATDRQSQALINGALHLAAQDPDWQTRWKGADGAWVTLTAPALHTVASYVGDHVQACFAQEAYWHDEIDQASDLPALQALALQIEAFW